MKRLFILFSAISLALHMRAETEIPFHFEQGFLYLSVRLEERAETLNFLLDSGATASVLNSATVQKLGLKRGARVQVSGVGATTSGYWPTRLKASVHQVPLPEKYLVLDLSQLSTVCSCNVDGLIGADFFKDKIVQIDFPKNTIRLLNQFPLHDDSATLLPLKTRQNGAILTQIQVNSCNPQWVRVDTGCASSLEWVSRKKSSMVRSKVSVGLAPLSITLQPVRLSLGPGHLLDLEAGVHPRPLFAGEDGLLGTGVLSQFIVTIDLTGRQLLLAPHP